MEMKSIHDCDQQEKMLRALLIIDAMTSFLPDIMCEDPKTPVEYFVHDVYAIAHAAHGTCGGCGTDNQWLDRIEKNAKLLKEAKIMDFEKVLQEIKGGKRPRQRDPKGLLHALETLGKVSQ